jgi:hypothetical protein
MLPNRKHLSQGKLFFEMACKNLLQKARILCLPPGIFLTHSIFQRAADASNYIKKLCKTRHCFRARFLQNQYDETMDRNKRKWKRKQALPPLDSREEDIPGSVANSDEKYKKHS